MRRLVCLLALLCAACHKGIAPGERVVAVGEVQNGFPNPWERAIFMAANRARSDPSIVKGPSSASYPAQLPLVLDYDLERSSRFHATMLAVGDAPLMHPSPCTLNNNVGSSGCDGAPSCGCQGGATCNNCQSCPSGTDVATRIGYFHPAGWSGEIAAAGYGDPWAVMDGWVDEPAGADGHRQIVDGASSRYAGFGHAASAQTACWPSFDVGDFDRGSPAVPKLASAAPSPYAGSPGGYRVYASWSDAAGAPSSIVAVVDGSCSAMSRELGQDALNATYFADVTLGNGCHSVYIIAKDQGGARITHPTTTAFTIAVGGGACADETTQPVAACEAPPPDLAAPPGSDLAALPDLAPPWDLRRAVVDLAGADLAGLLSGDLATGGAVSGGGGATPPDAAMLGGAPDGAASRSSGSDGRGARGAGCQAAPSRPARAPLSLFACFATFALLRRRAASRRARRS